jgi:hypothetical protein
VHHSGVAAAADLQLLGRVLPSPLLAVVSILVQIKELAVTKDPSTCLGCFVVQAELQALRHVLVAQLPASVDRQPLQRRLSSHKCSAHSAAADWLCPFFVEAGGDALHVLSRSCLAPNTAAFFNI